MALTPVVDSLDKVPEPLRTHYVQKDGKFHLDLSEPPPGFVTGADHATQLAKVVEFRDNNVKLLKEVEELRPLKTKYEGIDPEKAKTAITELEALKTKGIQKPDDVANQIKSAIDAAITPLREELTKSKTETLAERLRADQSTLRSVIGEKFIKAGGIPEALDFIINKTTGTFVVEAGNVKAAPNKFSSTKPGDALGIEEWLGQQTKESSFAFKSSSGGGAAPAGGGPTLKAGQTLLRDPTPQQLGEFAADIKAGKVKIVYTADEKITA